MDVAGDLVDGGAVSICFGGRIQRQQSYMNETGCYKSINNHSDFSTACADAALSKLNLYLVI